MENEPNYLLLFQDAAILAALNSKLTYDEPEAAFIEGLASRPALFEDEPVSSLPSDVVAVFQAATTNPDMEAIKADRTSLAYMLSVSRAYPWESVYRTDTHSMFGPTTLEVHELYQAENLSLTKDESEPYDHFGLEMAYIARVAQSYLSGELSETQAFERISKMLAEHISIFYKAYLGQMSTVAQTDYYKGVAAFVHSSTDKLISDFQVTPASTQITAIDW